jgi:hypothetical protein
MKAENQQMIQNNQNVNKASVKFYQEIMSPIIARTKSARNYTSWFIKITFLHFRKRKLYLEVTYTGRNMSCNLLANKTTVISTVIFIQALNENENFVLTRETPQYVAMLIPLHSKQDAA